MPREQILADPQGALPDAAQLFAGWFHQDWVTDRDTWESVVGDFVAESPPAAVRRCAADLSALLDAGIDASRMETVLERLGAGVDPTALGMSPDGFVRAVRDRLSPAG